MRCFFSSSGPPRAPSLPPQVFVVSQDDSYREHRGDESTAQEASFCSTRLSNDVYEVNTQDLFHSLERFDDGDATVWGQYNKFAELFHLVLKFVFDVARSRALIC